MDDAVHKLRQQIEALISDLHEKDTRIKALKEDIEEKTIKYSKDIQTEVDKITSEKDKVIQDHVHKFESLEKSFNAIKEEGKLIRENNET